MTTLELFFSENFLNREYSFKLKELGFSCESTFLYTDYCDTIYPVLDGHNSVITTNNTKLNTSCVIPTYIQVKNWFETNLGINITIEYNNDTTKFKFNFKNPTVEINKKLFSLSNKPAIILSNDKIKTTNDIINSMLLVIIDDLYLQLN
jgi:hypothetical protein